MNQNERLNMKILAIEFSTNYKSVAVGSDGEVIGYCEESVDSTLKPFKMIETALEKANVDVKEIDCVSVGIGPGSYTGIRIAISIAQGWQFARNVKLLGIDTVESMAEKLAYNKLDNKYRIVVDAQRGEFYCADYDVENGSFKCVKELSIIDSNAIGKTDRVLAGTDIRFKNAVQLTSDAKSIYRLSINNNNFVAGEKLEPIYLRPISFVKAPPPRILNIT